MTEQTCFATLAPKVDSNLKSTIDIQKWNLDGAYGGQMVVVVPSENKGKVDTVKRVLQKKLHGIPFHVLPIPVEEHIAQPRGVQEAMTATFLRINDARDALIKEGPDMIRRHLPRIDPSNVCYVGAVIFENYIDTKEKGGEKETIDYALVTAFDVRSSNIELLASEGCPFRQDFVDEAESRKTTVGKVFAERCGYDPGDPHKSLLGISRFQLIEKTFEQSKMASTWGSQDDYS